MPIARNAPAKDRARSRWDAAYEMNTLIGRLLRELQAPRDTYPTHQSPEDFLTSRRTPVVHFLVPRDPSKRHDKALPRSVGRAPKPRRPRPKPKVGRPSRA